MESCLALCMCKAACAAQGSIVRADCPQPLQKLVLCSWKGQVIVCVVRLRRILRVEVILIPLALALGWLLGLEQLEWCCDAVQGSCVWEVTDVLFLGQVTLEIPICSPMLILQC